jgi:toxin CcdB
MRFDVCRSRSTGTLLVDCQANHLSHLSTRFVVPLVPPADAPDASLDRLNSHLVIDGTTLVMLTQFSASIPVGDLGRRIATLADDDHRIVTALDTLIGTA